MARGDGRGCKGGRGWHQTAGLGEGRRQVAKKWARGSTVWKEESQGGGKDSPQVDTIAKSHQVQVFRCFYAPMSGREREEKDEKG